jgi:prepilin-type N-terminal cleavage/methylation domain-containing protein
MPYPLFLEAEPFRGVPYMEYHPMPADPGCQSRAWRPGSARKIFVCKQAEMHASPRWAFTLIELLIVVAIIAILAAIAVPNFLEAQIRAKVARIKADQRTMATAIESYSVDNNRPPVRCDNWQNPNNPKQAYPVFVEKVYAPTAPTAPVGLHTLTTPVSYISSLPRDLFYMAAGRVATPTNTLLDAMEYWDPNQTDAWLAVLNGVKVVGKAKGWGVVSVGPDGALGANQSGLPGGSPPETGTTAFTARIFYDPTNGSVSLGNIYRFAGDLQEKDILWN